MKKLVKDANALSDPLGELGWKDSSFEDYENQRDYLKKNNGIKDLKILPPKEVEEAKKQPLRRKHFTALAQNKTE